jgi:hypothetical protein
MNTNEKGSNKLQKNEDLNAAKYLALPSKEFKESIASVQVEPQNVFQGGVPQCYNITNFPIFEYSPSQPTGLHRQLPPDVVSRLRMDWSYDDVGKLKTILVVNLVELTLMVLAQYPRERAAFFPYDVASMIINHLRMLSYSRGLTDREQLLLRLLLDVPESRDKITMAHLFNADVTTTTLNVEVRDQADTEIGFDFNWVLGMTAEHYPFIHFACLGDHTCQGAYAIVEKAYSLARRLNIDTNNPFRASIDFLQDPANQLYVESAAHFMLPQNVPRVYVYGEQLSIVDVLIPVNYWGGTMYFPLTMIASTTSRYPKPMILPKNRLPLFGLAKLLHYQNEFICLTPCLHMGVINEQDPKLTVMSWWGSDSTIDLVDWTPLAGKTVYYLYRSNEFNNKIRADWCFNAVREKLLALGCNFLIVDLSDATFAPPLNQPPPNTQPDPYYSPVI